jgi:hypothetical protein
VKRLAAWCLFVATVWLVGGCSRLSTLYVYNNSAQDITFVALQEGRSETFVLPRGEWVRTAREYKPLAWRFELSSKGTARTTGVLSHNGYSADAFIEIDDKGWRKRGMPAWYFVETKIVPAASVLAFFGVVVLAVLAVRREVLRRSAD